MRTENKTWKFIRLPLFRLTLVYIQIEEKWMRGRAYIRISSIIAEPGRKLQGGAALLKYFYNFCPLELTRQADASRECPCNKYRGPGHGVGNCLSGDINGVKSC